MNIAQLRYKTDQLVHVLSICPVLLFSQEIVVLLFSFIINLCLSALKFLWVLLWFLGGTHTSLVFQWILGGESVSLVSNWLFGRAGASLVPVGVFGGHWASHVPGGVLGGHWTSLVPVGVLRGHWTSLVSESLFGWTRSSPVSQWILSGESISLVSGRSLRWAWTSLGYHRLRLVPFRLRGHSMFGFVLQTILEKTSLIQPMLRIVRFSDSLALPKASGLGNLTRIMAA